jgi:hypothetical protein
MARFGGCEFRIESLDDREGQNPSGHLSGEKARDRGGSDAGKLLENIRPTVIAGLANLVELVKK